MHASIPEQVQYFEEVLLPSFREFESALCSYTSVPAPASEQQLKRRFMLAAWAADYLLDLVTGKDAVRLLTLEQAECSLRILRRVMDDIFYARLQISTRSLLDAEELADDSISELFRRLPQLLALVNVAEDGEAPEVQEVDLFSCLSACMDFWQNTLPIDSLHS